MGVTKVLPPLATYRTQLNPDFGFDQIAELAGYLAELGISHVYCSPYLQAAAGSRHGYDVVDHSRVNDELGGGAAFKRMCNALECAGLSQLLDIVPNHMAIGGRENKWWWDVLENGPSSKYAAFFDVDWDPPEARLRNGILLPVLGAQYGKALEAGEIQLRRSGGAFHICYYDQQFPIAPRSLPSVLREAAKRSESEELAVIADILSELPLPTASDRASIARRHRDWRVIHRWLETTLSEHSDLATAVDSIIAEINRDTTSLHALLENQNYRLAYWRAAGRDLGYRRFFDINTLVGLRMEDPEVFAETHALILRLLKAGILDGLRVDHVDGLRDPEGYLRRLREASSRAWLLVEKILEPGESLPASWPVDGTTGYNFLCALSGVFINGSSEQQFTQIYADFTHETKDYNTLARDKKALIIRDVLGSDLNRLTAMLVEICEGRPRYRDYTRHEMHAALKAITVELPVYRTYVKRDVPHFSAEDRKYIATAVGAAKAAQPGLDGDLFDFIKDLLLCNFTGGLEWELALRFQQFTGPVMAKAIEDTAFYCFNRFVSLNEVGGDPAKFGTTVAEFYQLCSEVQNKYPLSMSATSTHDTKRSEDVRARLALLSEMPDEWASAVHNWARGNQRYWKTNIPDLNVEYLIYQTLLGTWPVAKERISSYLQKAVREAKEHTTWTQPDEKYEKSVSDFLDGILSDDGFVSELGKFVEPLIKPGRVNALSQVLIKLTAPGVPDFYQGSELWHFALVDPDNRGLVDYVQRRQLLEQLRRCSVERVVRSADEGLPKLWVTSRGLAVRRRFAAALGPEGAFAPMFAEGSRAEHVIAFCRGDSVIAIAPRLVIGLAGDWRDTTIAIPQGRWRNELSGELVDGGQVTLSSLTSRFPICLLVLE